MNKIVTNYKKILSEIDHYRNKFSLPLNQPKLIAVSKTFPKEKIQILIDEGHLIFGENKVQEASLKWKQLRSQNQKKLIELHLIGPLQSNKVNLALETFDVIQTLDREKIAIKIKKYFDEKGNIFKRSFFVQVNVGAEDQKSGIETNKTEQFVEWCVNDLNLNVKGLMCIPPYGEDSQPYFRKVKNLCEQLNLPHASMGMSNDFVDAIKNKATHIRVGTGIFGSRT